MTIYHVEKYYDKNDMQLYRVSPYNLKGSITTYLGFEILPFPPHWKMGYTPKNQRISDFINFLKTSYFSESKAWEFCKTLNQGKFKNKI